MQSEVRQKRVSSLKFKADRYELATFTWAEKVRRAISKALPEGKELRPSLRKVLRKMRAPDQGNFHKLLDLVSDEMTLTHGRAWVQSALSAIRPSSRDTSETSLELMEIHDALDNWTLNVLMYLRASGLIMRHTGSHFDPALRRGRLAAVVRKFRSTEDPDVARKAANIYSGRRFQHVILASNNAGKASMFMDPTVSVSFTDHRRVARPVAMPSFTFGEPTKEQVREANYIKDYNTFKETLKDLDEGTAASKLDFWLAARGLMKRPRRFTYANQVQAWDEMMNAYDEGNLMTVGRVITTGRFQDSGKIHPLATHWKRPLGGREWASWHRWWKR